MFGATKTNTGPDVAPAGIVIAMEVALHELMVTAIPFKYTTLPVCCAPKALPLINTWLATVPVVAERVVICGAGEAAVSTETLSKLAVTRLLGEPLDTARPT
jgi:hypothetical protein